MTVDMCDQKIWDVRASDLARNTHNPIRAIVESLQLEPNPSKQMISLSIAQRNTEMSQEGRSDVRVDGTVLTIPFLTISCVTLRALQRNIVVMEESVLRLSECGLFYSYGRMLAFQHLKIVLVVDCIRSGDPTIFGNLTPPREIIESVLKSADCGKCNGYAPSIGTVQARQAVAEYSSCSKYTVDWKDVILCSGCSTALDYCISVLANPGENILIPRPGFALYRTLAEGLGIRVKPYNLRPESRWEIDLDHLESQIDCNTKAIVVNNPSNPCGSVFSKRHLKEILDVASRNCIPIIADEIYEHLVFAGEEFFPLASLSSDVPILSCSGLTKRFLVPGWRVGWIVIHDRNDVFSKEIKPGLVKLSQRQLGCNTIVQGAISEILKFTPSDFYNNTIKTLQKNAMITFKRLSEIPGLTPVMPQGAMYIMIGIDMNLFPGIKNDLEFVEMMVTEESVFCLPGKCFDYPNYVRIIISPPEEMLKEACDRIADFCKRHYKAPAKKPSDNLTTYREVSLADSQGSEMSGRNLG